MVIGDWREDYNRRQATQLARDARPRRVRRRVDGKRAGAGRVTRPGGVGRRAARPSPLGTRYARAFATTAAGKPQALPCLSGPERYLLRASHPPPSHSWWTDKRGPATISRAKRPLVAGAATTSSFSGPASHSEPSGREASKPLMISCSSG